jgi:hypothetical protein
MGIGDRNYLLNPNNSFENLKNHPSLKKHPICCFLAKEEKMG